MDSTKEILRSSLGSTVRNSLVRAVNVAKSAGSSPPPITTEFNPAATLTLGSITQPSSLQAPTDIANGFVSRLKAAESGLKQINSLVEEMKKLAALGASAATNAQRFFVYTRIDDLKSEINAIGSRTSANGSKVLDGSLTSPTQTEFYGDSNTAYPLPSPVSFFSVTWFDAGNTPLEPFDAGDQFRIKIGATEQVFTVTSTIYTPSGDPTSPVDDIEKLQYALGNAGQGLKTYRGGLFDSGVSIKSGGTGFTNSSVNLSGGSGSGAQAQITTANSAITAVTITNTGSGYVSGDTLTIQNANASGFELTVNEVFSPLTGHDPALLDTSLSPDPNSVGNPDIVAFAADWSSEVRIRAFQAVSDSPPPDGATEVYLDASEQSTPSILRSFMDVQIRPLAIDAFGVSSLSPIAAAGSGYQSTSDSTSERVRLVSTNPANSGDSHPRGGADAFAVVRVLNGGISEVRLTEAGSNYQVGDVLTIDPYSDIATNGPGQGFQVAVAAVAGGNSSTDAFVFDSVYRAISEIAAPSGQTTYNFKTLSLVLNDLSNVVNRRIQLAASEVANMEVNEQLLGRDSGSSAGTNTDASVQKLQEFYTQRRLNIALQRSSIVDLGFTADFEAMRGVVSTLGPSVS